MNPAVIPTMAWKRDRVRWALTERIRRLMAPADTSASRSRSPSATRVDYQEAGSGGNAEAVRAGPRARPTAAPKAGGSVAFLLVDDGEQRLARAQAPEVLDERLDDPSGAAGRPTGRVGRHDHARMCPQSVPLGQRFRVGDVEAGAPQEPLVEGGEEIVPIDDPAARDIDEDARGPHASEEIAGEEVTSGLGQGQGDDHHVRASEHLVEAVGLPDGLHPRL